MSYKLSPLVFRSCKFLSLCIFTAAIVQGVLDPKDQLRNTLNAPVSIDELPYVEESNQSHCAPDTTETLHIVHWTHVPKAGGTTFAELAKRVSCEMNPQIKDVNPCCRKSLCLAPRQSCSSSASACPLVTGIGRHSSNMDRLLGAPCCGTGWSMLTSVVGFMQYAIKKVVNDPKYPKDPQHKLWPFEDRVKFLKRVGIP